MDFWLYYATAILFHMLEDKYDGLRSNTVHHLRKYARMRFSKGRSTHLARTHSGIYPSSEATHISAYCQR